MGDGTSCATTTCPSPPPPPPPPPPPAGCAQLLWIAVIALILGGILLALVICPGLTVLLTVGVILTVIGVAAFVLWALLCRKTTACPTMQAVQCLLFWLLSAAAVVFLVLVATIGLPCAASVGIPGILWGVAYEWLVAYMIKTSCPLPCP
jgi:hypothetical protein